jgi:hypothetical protein
MSKKAIKIEIANPNRNKKHNSPLAILRFALVSILGKQTNTTKKLLAKRAQTTVN